MQIHAFGCHITMSLAPLLLPVTLPPPPPTNQILSGARMDEAMLFLVVFMGSPGHVKSSHLRGKMSEVIHTWLPQVGVGVGMYG